MNDFRFSRHPARFATRPILFAVIDTSTHGQVVREIEDIKSLRITPAQGLEQEMRRLQAALLVELLRGPGYGLDLIERVRLRSGGRILLRQGVVHPALHDLSRRKWLRSWSVTTPGSGRPRTYHELTPKGLALAQAHRDAIAGFAAKAAPRRPTVRELEAMRQRLVQFGDVAEAAMWLRRAGKAAGL